MRAYYEIPKVSTDWNRKYRTKEWSWKQEPRIVPEPRTVPEPRMVLSALGYTSTGNHLSFSLV